ncbi:hypothetical protein [Pseudomonas sp. HY7a-MNA-CIBAN-0227]|uniref:hypothetical protein n=1 Tax=Pseudomonas sp. HY7a-MNA-CIBAN-0227 TaxID=3140474 RepID=UPI003320053C
MRKVLVFACTALIAGSAVSAESMNLCDANLQKLRDLKASISVMPQPLLGEVQSLRMDAQDAKDDSDQAKCIALTTKALQRLRTAKKT